MPLSGAIGNGENMFIMAYAYRHGRINAGSSLVSPAVRIFIVIVLCLFVSGKYLNALGDEIPSPGIYSAPSEIDTAGTRDDIAPVFDTIVSLPRQYSNIYSILNQISGQTGYFFAYDTDIVNSDRRVRIRAGTRTVASWLEEVLDDPGLSYRVIENHILIYRQELVKEQTAGHTDAESTESGVIIVRGRVLDEDSREPLPYATVGIKGESIGIISNSDGFFSLRVPAGNDDKHIAVSHIGYKTQALPVSIFSYDRVDILMETEYISIPEVMIRYFDPLGTLVSAISRIDDNYSSDPVYMLNFYREGVMRGNRFINYSEAFFQVYKSSHVRKFEPDQVRLFQSRTISNTDRTDTLILKIRAGIRSSLELDFIKNVPDFLNPEFLHEYEYTRADIVSYDGNMAYAVAFEQKDHITDPLFKGVLYIDMESLAFLGADFEVNPKHISKAHYRFITRKNRDYRATIDKAAYTVSYRYYNGHYYLNHVRADLHLRYRRRFSIFSSNYHVFVEMANSRIDTENVERFSRRDVLRTDRVFMDGGHAYDRDFWEGYTIVPPERHITEALTRIESQIERVVAGQNDK